MEALRSTYGSISDSDSDSGSDNSYQVNKNTSSSLNPNEHMRLPPPPVDLLQTHNSLSDFTTCYGNRVRSFPHMQGNFALHIFIPVWIPSMLGKQLASSMKIISSLVPNLYAIDVDIALNELCKDAEKFEQVILGREFHISLGRPVPIKVHQIDSIVAMLRQRLQFQRRYCIEFNRWEVFVNDELTRSFLSLEVTGGGLLEVGDARIREMDESMLTKYKFKLINRQICIVNEVYRLHGLPEFYENPRPHISLIWALGDVSNSLKPVAEELNKKFKNDANSSGRHIFKCNFSSIECKIGKKRHTICKLG